MQQIDHDTARRESRARRAAERLGLAVHKSRRNGTYMLVDTATTGVVASGGWGHGYGLDLETIETELRQWEQLDSSI